LGTKLAEPASTLAQFVAFLDREGAAHITTTLALQWAMAPQGRPASDVGAPPLDGAGFARWLSALDPHAEIPPPGALPGRRRRRRPYIFTDDEVRRLIAEAARRPSRTGVRH